MYNSDCGVVKDGDNEEVGDGNGYETPQGTVITVNNNVCTIGTGDDAVVLTATAGEDCTFAGWTYYDEDSEEYTSFSSLTVEGEALEIAPIFHA